MARQRKPGNNGEITDSKKIQYILRENTIIVQPIPTNPGRTFHPGSLMLAPPFRKVEHDSARKVKIVPDQDIITQKLKAMLTSLFQWKFSIMRRIVL